MYWTCVVNTGHVWHCPSGITLVTHDLPRAALRNPPGQCGWIILTLALTRHGGAAAREPNPQSFEEHLIILWAKARAFEAELLREVRARFSLQYLRPHCRAQRGWGGAWPAAGARRPTPA